VPAPSLSLGSYQGEPTDAFLLAAFALSRERQSGSSPETEMPQ